MTINILLLAAGFLILIKGADWLVEGAFNLAKKNNVSDLAIGMTIVAAGTSLPEQATSVISAINKNYYIAVGNIIGSNIFNILHSWYKFINQTSHL
jgi:cation:H+ antiporter